MTEHLNVACYDNDGASIDRYAVAYLDCPAGQGLYQGVTMNEAPFHPQGFGQHGLIRLGRHLGREIEFQSLPEDCRKLVLRDLSALEEEVGRAHD